MPSVFVIRKARGDMDVLLMVDAPLIQKKFGTNVVSLPVSQFMAFKEIIFYDDDKDYPEPNSTDVFDPALFRTTPPGKQQCV